MSLDEKRLFIMATPLQERPKSQATTLFLYHQANFQRNVALTYQRLTRLWNQLRIDFLLGFLATPMLRVIG